MKIPKINKFLIELKTIINFSDKQQKKKILNIPQSNPDYQTIVHNWMVGVYDDNPIILKQELIELSKK